jgi:hypothetical protein
VSSASAASAIVTDDQEIGNDVSNSA